MANKTPTVNDKSNNYRCDIYENLPCRSMISDAVNKIKSNESIIINNSNQNVTCKPNLSKEMLYATPLRKSDRFNYKSKPKQHQQNTKSAANTSCTSSSAMVGVSGVQKNTDNANLKANNTDLGDNNVDASSLNALGGANVEFNQRRITDFLKDTSQLQKKMELQKDFPNSNFSFLAREEHFANLVHQNVIADDARSGCDEGATHSNGETSMQHTAIDSDPLKNYEQLTKCSDLQRPIVDRIITIGEPYPSPARRRRAGIDATSININREWVLKKVALCLEQRIAKKPPIMAPHDESVSGAPLNFHNAATNLPQLGCLILGSNGSGKTSVCRNILEGTSGTKGMLNRKLLACFFINSQNPECHSLSMFIRSLVLQILSHSSFIDRDETEKSPAAPLIVPSAPPDALEEMLISELKLSERVAEFCAHRTCTNKKMLTRQHSDPIEGKSSNADVAFSYITHPPLAKANVEHKTEEKVEAKSKITSPNKKISKIPVPISSRVSKTEGEGKKVDANDSVDVSEESPPIEHPQAPIEKEEVTVEVEVIKEVEEANETVVSASTDTKSPESPSTVIKPIPLQRTIPPEEIQPGVIPLPLPKSKSCRSIIADGYYELLVSNPDIFDSLNVETIEKNPDECFKNAILFPLLELCAPKNALLILVDSIDENYINEGNLVSTLKGRNPGKSRNIAELLANHIHLFPRWMFLVCTAKKQNKHISKMFTGFKKITLDDLRKSHVVKDVQEYIICRLNTDFKGLINLSREVIESLNQLYIKSNGCILYLHKVMNGIRENFFTFREIKLIPCTLSGLYLYICQKSFNKKQYMKIRPILNILLACTGYVERTFVYNCLRTHNYTIDIEEFDKRIEIMRNILVIEQDQIRIFHNSFCDWLVDVKFSTKKFLCDVNEGHIMIAMYCTLISNTLCANRVRKFIYHLIKSGEYMSNKNMNLDLMLILLESKTNLSDCFYTNLLNCCKLCENECKADLNFAPKTRQMIEKYLNGELVANFTQFLGSLFKPNLPTDAKTLKLLIETGINNAESQISYDSSAVQSPILSEQSQNNDSELAELLITSERSCNQDVQQSKGVVAGKESMNEIAHAESTNTVQLLSDMHCIELQKGKAFIHLLANEGNHVLLERALKACKDPIDLEIEDLNGQTALNIAARNGHLAIVKLLVAFEQIINDGTNGVRTIDVNHADRDGWTPLRSASWGGHTEVVKLLIAHPNCSIDLADKEGRTALRAAAWSGHEDILKILIEAGANVNSVDKQGRTSLIAASYMGHYDIVEILLENGAHVNHLDLDGRSALCVAALCGSSGYSKVISCLLEHGAHTDQLDNDGMSPLLVSSFEGNAEVCELLLENGADPDLADYIGRTPLWAACTAGHAVVVKLLLFWGCSIDCMDSEGRTVLSIAAAQGNLETVRQLLDRGLDETHRDNAGWTPLHYAAFEGYADICVQLLESGAKIDECDNEGKTALHLSSQEGHSCVIEALLDVHTLCIDQRAHDGKTAFRLACLEEHYECIQILLKYSCDVNTKDADSRTTVYILALENKLKLVNFLLEYASIDVNIPDSEGRSALHVAAWQGHADMVKLLITIGTANVNSMDLECRTPLHSCAWQGNYAVMDILLYYGAIADHACKQGATALGISAQEGHEQCVSVLLQYGANPYKSDHCGRTPIKLATKSNRNNVMKILENFTKDDMNLAEHQPNLIIKSPDKHHDKSLVSYSSQSSNQNSNFLAPNNLTNVINASSSTQSSNFYENTMHSDTSSLHKRKSVISSQSTASSNETPISFTQQLQKHSRYHSIRSSQVLDELSNRPNYKASKNHQKHSHILPNVDEYQANINTNMPVSEADRFDMGAMSPLYASPPHSPSSDISSPGQHLPQVYQPFEEIGTQLNNVIVSSQTTATVNADNHFARDTHMRIILGNNKDANHSGGKSSKRSGIVTNPAMRMIRSRFDSAAQLIRRTNNMLNITSNSNSQGSSSIGVKSGTFQWRKES